MDIPTKHKRKIARDNLANKTPAMAAILGGQSFAESYRIIFDRDLVPRLESLITEYGIACKGQGFTWELAKYGWNPVSLREAIRDINPVLR